MRCGQQRLRLQTVGWLLPPITLLSPTPAAAAGIHIQHKLTLSWGEPGRGDCAAAACNKRGGGQQGAAGGAAANG